MPFFELDPEKFGADNPRDAARLFRLCAKATRLEQAGRSTTAVEQEMERIQEDSRLRAEARQAERDAQRRGR
ncbi:hypothetical protein ACFC1R_37565 [Kitasatospora sp. NPDC056138]|uniref:hypothetical protein n=1 Tax=Kitasatospora sp. NPDC056138 TaxID=3345724 RepID=UPI0035D7E14C